MKIDEFALSIEGANSKIADFRKESNELGKALTSINIAKSNRKAAYDSYIQALDADIQKRTEAVESAWTKKNQTLNSEAKIGRDRKAATDDRIRKEKELSEIQAVDISVFETEVANKNREKATVAENLSNLKIAEKDVQRKAKLESDQARQIIDVEALAAIVEASGPKGIPGQLLREKVAPFLESVNNILHRFVPDMEFDIQFQDDRGKESCQLGFRSDGIWTLFESASGAEKYLILFAVIIALMNRQPLVNQKIVLLDEIASLDQNFAPVLIQAAEIAVDENLVDQVLLAGALRNSDLEIIMTSNPNVFDSMIVTSSHQTSPQLPLSASTGSQG